MLLLFAIDFELEAYSTDLRMKANIFWRYIHIKYIDGLLWFRICYQFLSNYFYVWRLSRLHVFAFSSCKHILKLSSRYYLNWLREFPNKIIILLSALFDFVDAYEIVYKNLMYFEMFSCNKDCLLNLNPKATKKQDDPFLTSKF